MIRRTPRPAEDHWRPSPFGSQTDFPVDSLVKDVGLSSFYSRDPAWLSSRIFGILQGDPYLCYEPLEYPDYGCARPHTYALVNLSLRSFSLSPSRRIIGRLRRNHSRSQYPDSKTIKPWSQSLEFGNLDTFLSSTESPEISKHIEPCLLLPVQQKPSSLVVLAILELRASEICSTAGSVWSLCRLLWVLEGDYRVLILAP